MHEDPEVTLMKQHSRRLVPLEPGTLLVLNGVNYRAGKTFIANDLDSPHYAGSLYEIVRQDGTKFGLQVSHLRRSDYVALIQLVAYLASYPPNAYSLGDGRTVTVGDQTYRSIFSSTSSYMKGGRRGEQRYIMFTDKNDPHYPRLTLVQYDHGNWVLETKLELTAQQVYIP